jgi:hypothetical protein
VRPLEGLGKLKNTMALSGIEPATFLLVALVLQPTMLPRVPNSSIEQFERIALFRSHRKHLIIRAELH